MSPLLKMNNKELKDMEKRETLKKSKKSIAGSKSSKTTTSAKVRRSSSRSTSRERRTSSTAATLAKNKSGTPEASPKHSTTRKAQTEAHQHRTQRSTSSEVSTSRKSLGLNNNSKASAPIPETASRRERSTSTHTKQSNRRMGKNQKSTSPLSNPSNRSQSNSVGINPFQKYDDHNLGHAPNPPAIFIHGTPEDDSWNAQVCRLRDDTDRQHAYSFPPSSLQNNTFDDNMRIRVIIRKRPMSKKERNQKGEVDVIHPLGCDTFGKILVYQPKTRVDLTKEMDTVPFAFDNVFDEHADNVRIYQETVQSLIPGVFEGRWASVFAYGQTGSGKTFTMMGDTLTGNKNSSKSKKNKQNRGLYYLAAQDVFHRLSQSHQQLTIGASLFEIYGGKLYDLLNARNPIKCLEDHRAKVCFPGLSEHPCTSAPHLMTLIEAGAAYRSVGVTSANADSSRSHAVLQLSLRRPSSRSGSQATEHGRLTFIDLAGSERGADTAKASRTTRLEGADINTSLLALKEVIRALATNSSMSRIPFRGSKLTQVLKESFVGKASRTVMVACVAPNNNNCEHTLNTLRYADRVKERNSETGEILGVGQQHQSPMRGKRAPGGKRGSIPHPTQRPSTAPAPSSNMPRECPRNPSSLPRKKKTLNLSGNDGDRSIDYDDEWSTCDDDENDVNDLKSTTWDDNTVLQTPPGEHVSHEYAFNNRSDADRNNYGINLDDANSLCQKESNDAYEEDDDYYSEAYSLQSESICNEFEEDYNEDEGPDSEEITVVNQYHHHHQQQQSKQCTRQPQGQHGHQQQHGHQRNSDLERELLADAAMREQKDVERSLVATHRSVTTEMLTMVKQEMSLVNCTDTDRDNIKDYLSELDSIQEKQLSLIGSLRESLMEFYAHRQRKEGRVHGSNGCDGEPTLTEDSFEDLRD